MRKLKSVYGQILEEAKLSQFLVILFSCVPDSMLSQMFQNKRSVVLEIFFQDQNKVLNMFIEC